MKRIILSLVISQLVFSSLMAQTPPLPPVDKSPMDMCYFPVNYPVLKIQDKATEPLLARVVYSRPQKAGRAIFGGLVQYGDLWRLGANEATEIEFYKNAYIGGKKISKGRYTLYAIVNEKTWTFIVNKETDTWGAFRYNIKKDVVRTDIPVQITDPAIESLAMTFEKTTGGCNLVIAWENTKVSVPISF
jgi:Protein of unknown function (DUF2911)